MLADVNCLKYSNNKHNDNDKYQSFIQLTGAKAYVKPTLEMYVLQSL